MGHKPPNVWVGTEGWSLEGGLVTTNPEAAADLIEGLAACQSGIAGSSVWACLPQPAGGGCWAGCLPVLHTQLPHRRWRPALAPSAAAAGSCLHGACCSRGVGMPCCTAIVCRAKDDQNTGACPSSARSCTVHSKTGCILAAYPAAGNPAAPCPAGCKQGLAASLHLAGQQCPTHMMCARTSSIADIAVGSSARAEVLLRK